MCPTHMFFYLLLVGEQAAAADTDADMRTSVMTYKIGSATNNPLLASQERHLSFVIYNWFSQTTILSSLEFVLPSELSGEVPTEKYVA